MALWSAGGNQDGWMSRNKQAVRGVRTGGRSARVRAAVLEATLAVLAESGYEAVSFDAVAARAEVSKSTVYRRWSDRSALVVDALTDWTGADVPIPDTGSVEGDLLTLASSLIDLFNSRAGRAVVNAVLGVGGHPELGEVKRRLFESRHGRAAVVVERAVARGELGREVDAAELMKALTAPLFYRLVVTGEELDEAVARRAVDVVLAAARAGALDRLSARQV